MDRVRCVIEIVEYRDAWPTLFAELGCRLRRGLGEVALRIDHIGSTAVPGLRAKPVLDIQVSVAAFEPAGFRAPLEAAGFAFRADNPDLTKRYFRETSGPRTHVHVRRAGSFAEQFCLMLRDYLRESPRTRSCTERGRPCWPSGTARTGVPIRRRSPPWYGSWSAGPTSGRRHAAGSPAPVMPDWRLTDAVMRPGRPARRRGRVAS